MTTLLKLTTNPTFEQILNALIVCGCHDIYIVQDEPAEYASYYDTEIKQFIYENSPHTIKVSFLYDKEQPSHQTYHNLTITFDRNDKPNAITQPFIFENYTQCEMKFSPDNNSILLALSDYFEGSYIRFFDPNVKSANLFRTFVKKNELNTTLIELMSSLSHLSRKEMLFFTQTARHLNQII